MGVRVTRYQTLTLSAIAAAMFVSWYHARYPDQMYLQHIPTITVLIVSPILLRRFPLTTSATTCLGIFLLLHVLGARYLYSNVPYDRWTHRVLGVTLTEIFRFRRNHFDRLVDFAFGLLSFRLMWEVCVRHLRMPRHVAYYTAFEFVLAFSMLYELVEWGLSMILAPQNADSYNGQQGDMWDAQKDMSAALLGATLAVFDLFLTRRGREGVPHLTRSRIPEHCGWRGMTMSDSQ